MAVLTGPADPIAKPTDGPEVTVEEPRVHSKVILNGIQCECRQVEATGGGLNVALNATLQNQRRGEVKAFGGDYLVTLPDGEQVIMSARVVDLFVDATPPESPVLTNAMSAKTPTSPTVKR